MKFYIHQTSRGISISCLVKVYKGAFRIENSLDVNIFEYDDSWNNLTGEDRVIMTAEFILASFSKNRCKRFTERVILEQTRKESEVKSFLYSDDRSSFKVPTYNLHLVYEDPSKRDTILQEIDIPIEKLIFDKNKITKNNYIIQLSLLNLNK